MTDSDYGVDVKTARRCAWPAKDDELMIKYHDEEWGVEVHDDRKLFEFIVLESAQAGLSWKTILHRRENYRKAFHGFDYKQIAAYTDQDLERLLNDKGIIRNRLKILATINNAKRFMEIQNEFGSFDKYIWGFVKGPIINDIKTIKDVVAKSALSDIIALDMKKRGFKFMGSTIVYAHMQATGMIDDHENHCFRKSCKMHKKRE
jgi:DNA-3-methyladenine glycosylase I